MLIALTREVSPSFAACELTHLAREAINVSAAQAQHQAYTAALAAAGCQVQRLPADAALPDSVFIEDLAVVVSEVAVISRPGAESRRGEAPAVAQALLPHRPLHFLTAPATLDGGDVLVVGRDVYVGASTRTNQAGLEQLQAALAPYGYSTVGVKVSGCLHLKSAVTAVADDLLLLNPRWVSPDAFGGRACLAVDPAEPHAANALRAGETVIYPASFPATAAALECRGVSLRLVDVSELQKAEGAVTCCSLVFTR